jgi:hypothetical protein
MWYVMSFILSEIITSDSSYISSASTTVGLWKLSVSLHQQSPSFLRSSRLHTSEGSCHPIFTTSFIIPQLTIPSHHHRHVLPDYAWFPTLCFFAPSSSPTWQSPVINFVYGFVFLGNQVPCSYVFSVSIHHRHRGHVCQVSPVHLIYLTTSLSFIVLRIQVRSIEYDSYTSGFLSLPCLYFVEYIVICIFLFQHSIHIVQYVCNRGVSP